MVLLLTNFHPGAAKCVAKRHSYSMNDEWLTSLWASHALARWRLRPTVTRGFGRLKHTADGLPFAWVPFTIRFSINVLVTLFLHFLLGALERQNHHHGNQIR